MKKLLVLSSLVPLLCATGCGALGTLNANTPHTTIKGQIAGQPFSIENPKDTVLEGLAVTASTNGTASIKIERLATVMNPVNTAATGDATAKIVDAGANAFKAGWSERGIVRYARADHFNIDRDQR